MPCFCVSSIVPSRNIWFVTPSKSSLVIPVGFDPLAYPGILFGGGVRQIQLRTEDRESGDLGAVAP